MKYVCVIPYVVISIMFAHNTKVADSTALAILDYICAVYFSYRAFSVLSSKKVKEDPST